MAAPLVLLAGIDPGRQHDVVAEPGALVHVGERDRGPGPAIHEPPPAGDEPRLVDEEAALGAAVEEAVAVRGENRAPLADVQDVGPRPQPDQGIGHAEMLPFRRISYEDPHAPTL